MAAPPILWLDGGLSTLLEERHGGLHPRLWSGAKLLEPEGAAQVRVALRCPT
jgi:hypothetical protein